MTQPEPMPRKLTVEDLDRFVARPPQPDEVTECLNRAAVLAAFDPFPLVATLAPATLRANVISDLLPRCEQTGPGAGSWTLLLPERRAALRRLGGRPAIRATLDAMPHHPDSDVQRVFEKVVDGEALNPATMSRDELAATLTVHDWVDGILDGLPAPAAIQQAIARADLLAPMQRLAGATFVGREDELERLDTYFEHGAGLPPLFVFGPGGVGKSTLVARFILEYAAARSIPTAYIDLDRPAIQADRPLTLLLDAAQQLARQLLPPSGADSLLKEFRYAIGREESGRQLETLAAAGPHDWQVRQFQDAVGMWTQGRPVLIVIDTMEEAQFLGSDVMWPLMMLIKQVTRAPHIRTVLCGRVLPEEYMSAVLGLTMPDGVDELPDFAQVPAAVRPVNLAILEPADAHELLGLLTRAEGLALSDRELDDVIEVVSSNPMCLKLAARVLREEGTGKLRSAPSATLARLKTERIQALLYGRILRQLHSDDVRKVAYPGLIVRRIDPAVVRQVLAEPCGLELAGPRNEHTIIDELRKEASLVEVDPADGSLRHRSDVRRAMLADLTDHVDPEVIDAIDRNAVRFYEPLPGAIARAEEIYHRLRLKQPLAEVEARWMPEAGARLKRAIDELGPEQRLWLADKLDVSLDTAQREAADHDAWEAQARRAADRWLQRREPERALKVLHERPARSPRSPLYTLEAEAYRFLGRPDDALRVAREGVTATTQAGALDMALELLLKMVVIAETQGNVEQAAQLLKEAAAVATHSSNDLLKLRVAVTELRLQRQLHPAERKERADLRAQTLASLTPALLAKLRRQPVLLREVAAELAKQDARLTSLAIETLGMEVGTDAQAVSLGKAIVTLNKSGVPLEEEAPALQAAAGEFEKAEFDPDVIRNWVTHTMTSRDTRRLGEALAATEAGHKALSGFRQYFRAGVAHTLRGFTDV